MDKVETDLENQYDIEDDFEVEEEYDTKELMKQMRLRPFEAVQIDIPKDVLESLNKVAEEKDMSLQALLKYYIGNGLRQDYPKRYI